MDIKEMDQGLLQKNPSMTQEEFSHHWFYNHAPLVVPFFLHSGLKHYEQIHGPLSLLSSPTASTPKLPLTQYSGACGLPAQEILNIPLKDVMPEWKIAYYEEVIKADERRFLVSEALDHIERVGPGSVEGDRRVVIHGGKSLIEVPEGVWRVWREYEGREGEGEGDIGGK